jgi:hypothetical protein
VDQPSNYRVQWTRFEDLRTRREVAYWHQTDMLPQLPHVRFSNRPFGVKHFQTIHHCNVDVARGLLLLFGIGTRALPPWGSKTRRNNLLVGLAVRRTSGPSEHANSPHSSSREGYLSTARWSSTFLLSGLILNCFHAAAATCSRVHRNSVPSTQMRCMITASRRAPRSPSSSRGAWRSAWPTP